MLRSKKGDFVLTIDPARTGGADVRVVVEAKDRAMSGRAIRDELREAKENRAAAVAVAVFGRTTRPRASPRSMSGPATSTASSTRRTRTRRRSTPRSGWRASTRSPGCATPPRDRRRGDPGRAVRGPRGARGDQGHQGDADVDRQEHDLRPGGPGGAPRQRPGPDRRGRGGDPAAAGAGLSERAPRWRVVRCGWGLWSHPAERDHLVGWAHGGCGAGLR